MIQIKFTNEEIEKLNYEYREYLPSRHKLPEPARLAHEYANMCKRQERIKSPEQSFENDNSFIL